MPTEWISVAIVAVVAFVVAATAGRRAGEHAERRAGRRVMVEARRRGPVGAVLDLVDESVAMYAVRRRLGRSTATRAERRAEDVRLAAIAQAEAIRRQRLGLPPTASPTQLILSGSTHADRHDHAAPGPPEAPWPNVAHGSLGTRGRSIEVAFGAGALRIEVVVAALALVAVLAIVIVAIWPRPDGGVLSATGAPSGVTSPASTPTLSPALTPPG